MKLLFSEYKSDYNNYIFPYVIWAIPENGENADVFFDKGFLPSSGRLDRYYMCRNIRINLENFVLSSENRRIMRKGNGITYRLIKRSEFNYNKKWQKFCKIYADKKFGLDVMTNKRLDFLFNSKLCTNIMLYSEDLAQKFVGLVVLFVQESRSAFYYYSFYDLDFDNKNLGIYIMTSTIEFMKNFGIKYIYLGSCYSRNALYKTQFQGCEFWNGFRWSTNLKELKYLIKRDENAVDKHLLETPDFQNNFYPDFEHNFLA